MGEVVKIQKLGEDLIIVFPKDVVEKSNLEEGCLVEIESFFCCGTSGVRIKSKIDTEKYDPEARAGPDVKASMTIPK